MKTACLKFILTALIALGLEGKTIHAGDEPPRFGSDHGALKLTGVWVVHMHSSSGMQLSLGIQNVGSVPLKAFRATLLKINDFDESEETLTLEFSSESDYNAKGSHHILKPGETIFFNVVGIDELHSKTSLSSVSWIRQLVAMGSQKSEKDQEATVNALLAEGRFILKFTKVVNAEAKDLSFRPERPIDTPFTPVPKSKEELAEKNPYPQK
jgi:hypothetical protein